MRLQAVSARTAVRLDVTCKPDLGHLFHGFRPSKASLAREKGANEAAAVHPKLTT